MGYKLKTHSGAANALKKLDHLLKAEVLIGIIFLQSSPLKEKDIIRGLNKLTGTVLKMASV